MIQKGEMVLENSHTFDPPYCMNYHHEWVYKQIEQFWGVQSTKKKHLPS